ESPAIASSRENDLPVDRAEWTALAPILRASAALAFFVAASCCALVFIIFPRFNFNGFHGQFLQPVRRTGFTNQVDLGKTGRIFSDESIVRRVEMPTSDRDHWSGYLRGAALGHFDGKIWQRTPGQFSRLYHTSHDEIHIPIRPGFPGAHVHQS